jgi:hypothetical protein
VSFLAPSTNASYEGSPLAAWLLAFVGVTTILPGLIHVFLPDGGAGVIAGMDLSGNGRNVVGVFAWAGATQIAWGIALLTASLRYRPLVPPLLALVLLERTLIALNLWVLKAPPGGHRPPEAYATLVAIPLLAAALALSVRRGGVSSASR